ncbi:MAG: rRNA pseudouridine synthase [Candidatus Eremiobacteraeota bacterium]|nr:rRNA pseudouridine synthase [Candidatus Eremiobacteraeota bacterium]
MKERLHKYIARCGVASRRRAEKLIAGGEVKVNGSRVSGMGITIDPDIDRVEVNGKIILPSQGHTYYAVYKPIEYISTVEDPHAKKKVIDLVPSSPRVFPVGRLDKDSEGLMILTDDGELANLLTHPRHDHEKEYLIFASANRPISRDEVIRKLDFFKKGTMLDDKETRPAIFFLEELKDNMIEFRLILKEGKKRQIRRMCEKIGLKVERLIRIRIGKLVLGNLQPGKYRTINKENVL